MQDMNNRNQYGVLVCIPYYDTVLSLPFHYQTALQMQGVVDADALKSNCFDLTLRDAIQTKLRLSDRIAFKFYIDEIVYRYKHVYLYFDKYGLGLDILGALDKLVLGDIDRYTLGGLSHSYVDWLLLNEKTISPISTVSILTEERKTQMRVSDTSIIEKQIYLGTMQQNTYATGIVRQHTATLGELDGKTMAEIDSLLMSFHVYDNLPAEEG